MGRRMTLIKLRYIKKYRRNGKIYYYFRRKGCPIVALPGAPGSREFNAAYEAAMHDKPSPTSNDAAGTIGKLITGYYGSVDFSNLKPNSRRLYRGILDAMKKQHGHRMVREMGRDNARKIVETIGAKRPGMGNLARAVMMRLMRYAISTNWRNDNPFSGISAYKIGTRHTWTDEELAAYETRWPIGTAERLDFAALLYTGQRGGDVVRMLRPGPKATTIAVRQEKTGADLIIPIHPELRRAYQAFPSKGLSLLGDERGRPIGRDALTSRIKKAAAAAGLSGECKAHGLRKALMRRMAEAGNSSKEIAAVSGHKTLKEIERYTAAADQARLAEQAMSNVKAIRHLPGRKPLKSPKK